MDRSVASANRTDAPRRVAVVGAGMIGLATAWYLQEHGVEVTVLDRTGVAAGSSWGNSSLSAVRIRYSRDAVSTRTYLSAACR